MKTAAQPWLVRHTRMTRDERCTGQDTRVIGEYPDMAAARKVYDSPFRTGELQRELLARQGDYTALIAFRRPSAAKGASR